MYYAPSGEGGILATQEWPCEHFVTIHPVDVEIWPSGGAEVSRDRQSLFQLPQQTVQYLLE